MSNVSSTSSSASAGSASSIPLVPSTGSKTLSQNDFLNLLVTQMTSQDPLNPTSDTQMAANMAQFTALSQANTMSANISSLLAQQQVVQANSMIGSTVSLQVDPKTTASGVVQSVDLSTGVPQIVVNNTPYNLGQVLSISK